jgi:hypothetical protein
MKVPLEIEADEFAGKVLKRCSSCSRPPKCSVSELVS